MSHAQNLPSLLFYGCFCFVITKISFHNFFCPIPQLRLICSSFEFRSNYGKSMEVDLHGSQSEKRDGE